MSLTDKLLAVQEHDCRIRELEKELRDVPKRKDEEQLRLKDHKEALAKAEEALKGKLAEIKKFELEGDAKREKISKFRTQQFELKTNKEFKAIEAEIKGVQDGIAGLEDQQLVLMEDVEKARAEVQKKKMALAEEEKAVLKDVSLLDGRMNQIGADLKAVKERRDVAAKDADPQWLKRYERIFSRKDRGLVPIEDGVCGGCHMALPPYIIHGAKRTDSIVACEYCGRMLHC